MMEGWNSELVWNWDMDEMQWTNEYGKFFEGANSFGQAFILLWADASILNVLMTI